MIDDYRFYLHHRWMEGCTNTAALTRDIQQLGYRSDVNTARRYLRPYRTGTVPADLSLPHPTVRRVADWITPSSPSSAPTNTHTAPRRAT
ncbi:hypothetical protein [Streptomyces olivochromogenes]|uniref:hypothetical protein n=1 Tax=Streptomyces olivochromogenes TaxID=1963 RepID=UPI0036ADE334